MLCVSGGKPFTKPQGYKDVIEIKANWTRARKEYGPTATDFTVEAPANPKVNVGIVIELEGHEETFSRQILNKILFD